ncbi:hypothetical protein ACLBXM_21745 [Xanthobacteraceae bacterium A53D]
MSPHRILARAIRAHVRLLTLFGLLAMGVAAGPGVAAPAREPLLIPGKTTLYQRILTRPDTPLTREPGAGQAMAHFPPFSIFYVYARKSEGGAEYVEVGRSLDAGAEGWIPADKAIEWRQSIVLGFNNPANRPRTLLFKSREGLEGAYMAPDAAGQLEQLRRKAETRTLPRTAR